jgi:TPR repeat protein
MHLYIAFAFASSALFAQGTLPNSPSSAPRSASGFQVIANPNDERLKLFQELDAKADAGDTAAMRTLGEYYFNGRFPVLKDVEKAKETWIKGASLGSSQCASMIHIFAYDNADSTDSETVIEKTKWFIIQYSLSRQKYPPAPSNVSSSSFEEAKSRAAAFLAGVKVRSPASTGSSQGMIGGQVDPGVAGVTRRAPALRFESLSLFDAHRKNVCAAYIKAASAIYDKGDAASETEKAAYVDAALELVRLQTYVGKSRRLSLTSKNNAAMRAVNAEKMNEFYAKMAAAKIATSLPASRADLNEGTNYINALGQLMQLPVSLGGS